MKRECTEVERKLLYENRQLLCIGKFKKMQGIKLKDFFISFFIWIILMSASMLVFSGISSTLFYIFIIMLLNITLGVVGTLFKSKRAKKEKKKFLSNDKILINGASVVKVSKSRCVIGYIEDGCKESNGNQYVVEYPACKSDLKGLSKGDRIILLYNGKAKSDNAHIMKICDSTKEIILGEKIDFSNIGMNNISIYPHSSCEKINKYPRVISKKERILLQNENDKAEEKLKVTIIRLSIITMIIFNLIMVVLWIIFKLGLLIIVSCFVVSILFAVLFPVVAMKLRKRSEKRWTNFNTVTEVVFIKSSTSYNCEKTVVVYEWQDNRFKEISYVNAIIQDTEMGDILYKVEVEPYTFFYKKDAYVN